MTLSLCSVCTLQGTNCTNGGTLNSNACKCDCLMYHSRVFCESEFVILSMVTNLVYSVNSAWNLPIRDTLGQLCMFILCKEVVLFRRLKVYIKHYTYRGIILGPQALSFVERLSVRVLIWESQLSEVLLYTVCTVCMPVLFFATCLQYSLM